MISNRFQRLKNNSGLLLVESLLAIVIMGVAVTAAVRSLTYSLKVYRLTTRYLTALNLIEEKIDDIELAPQLQPGETSGVFLNKEFSWRVRIENLNPTTEASVIPEETPEAEPVTQYYKILSRVEWGHTQKYFVSADTLVMKKKEALNEEDEEKGATPRNTRGSETLEERPNAD